MRIILLSVGRRPPPWVRDGFDDYSRRLPGACALQPIEIDPVPRGKATDSARARDTEGERLLKAVPRGAEIVALDPGGRQWSTEELAGKLDAWRADGQDRALLVGGADGLSPACLAQARQRWSLSRLTFPHALVRVIVAEQIYRAWSLLQGHPYHRGGERPSR